MLSQFADVIQVVVIEDDPADALLAEEYLSEEESAEFDIRWTKTLAEGVEAITSSTHCVLLDLGLPDADGVSALEAVRQHAPRVPIVVLTGHSDRKAGTRAVNAGAQDYLVKSDVTPAVLARSIAYAMARAGNEERDLRLLEAELRRQENQRLALGLKPHLRVTDPELRCVSLYEPASVANLLGGDFLDAVELPDGTVRLVLGDVSGHGPDEAALGVSLRVGWRSLVLAGSDERSTLSELEQLLVAERPDPFTFATVCQLTLSPDRSTLSVALAGHPPPLLAMDGTTRLLEVTPDPPLGVPGRTGRMEHVELGPTWSLLAFSDGIFEVGRSGDGGLGLDRFAALAGPRLLQGPIHDGVLGELAEVAEAEHGPFEDDVALLACSRTVR